MNTKLSLTLKIIVSVLLVRFVLSRIDLGDVVEVFSEIRLGYFAFAVLLSFAAHYLATIKWMVLLEPLRIRVSMGHLFRLNLISAFYTMFLPGGQLTGQAAKAYRSLEIPGDGAQIVGSVVVDRMTGLLPVLILSLAALFLSPTAIEIEERIVLIFSVMAIASVVSFLTFDSGVYGRIVKRVASFPSRYSPPFVDRILDLIGKGSMPYMDRFDVLGRSIAWGALFQLVNTLMVFILALALGIDVLFIDLLWVFALVSIILLVPTSIMGLGQREISFVFLLGLTGVHPAAATSLSLALFAASLASSLVGGLLEAHTLGAR